MMTSKLFPFLLFLQLLAICVPVHCDYRRVLNDITGTVHKGRLFSHQNEGCLDGGYSIAPSRTLLYAHLPPCPKVTHNEWSFKEDGTLSTLIDGKVNCLECTDALANCYLSLTSCQANDSLLPGSQQFLFRVISTQIDWHNRRLYFSIYSQLHPNRCLTAYYDYHTVALKETYIQSWRFTDLIAVNNGTLFQGKHSGFRLEVCTGSKEQSFFLERKWIDDVEEFLDNFEKLQAEN